MPRPPRRCDQHCGRPPRNIDHRRAGQHDPHPPELREPHRSAWAALFKRNRELFGIGYAIRVNVLVACRAGGGAADRLLDDVRDPIAVTVARQYVDRATDWRRRHLVRRTLRQRGTPTPGRAVTHTTATGIPTTSLRPRMWATVKQTDPVYPQEQTRRIHLPKAKARYDMLRGFGWQYRWDLTHLIGISRTAPRSRRQALDAAELLPKRPFRRPTQKNP